MPVNCPFIRPPRSNDPVHLLRGLLKNVRQTKIHRNPENIIKTTTPAVNYNGLLGHYRLVDHQLSDGFNPIQIDID